MSTPVIPKELIESANQTITNIMTLILLLLFIGMIIDLARVIRS